jgi:hypothetical protein
MDMKGESARCGSSQTTNNDKDIMVWIVHGIIRSVYGDMYGNKSIM